jgi:hypothetical protein
MREDLEQRGVGYTDAWEARLFTYRRGEDAVEAAAFLREAVVGASRLVRSTFTRAEIEELHRATSGLLKRRTRRL